MSTIAAPLALRAVLGLGSNLGSREGLLRAAIDLLTNTRRMSVIAISRLWETLPIGPPQPVYFNAAVYVETTLSPTELLGAIQVIEADLGRVRDIPWGPRTVDIDILWMDGVVVAEGALTIPHPHLRGRAFALGPLCEVCPDARDPRTGTLYHNDLTALGDTTATVRLLNTLGDITEIDHTADEGFAVTARDRADLLATCADALGGLIVARETVAPRTLVPVHVSAPEGDWPDDERMLAWLSEVLYRLDAGRLALRRAVVLRDDPSGVYGLLAGEALDEDRHTVRCPVKAVTWHGLEVEAVTAGSWRAQVIVDI